MNWLKCYDTNEKHTKPKKTTKITKITKITKNTTQIKIFTHLKLQTPSFALIYQCEVRHDTELCPSVTYKNDEEEHCFLK